LLNQSKTGKILQFDFISKETKSLYRKNKNIIYVEHKGKSKKLSKKNTSYWSGAGKFEKTTWDPKE
jgi:RecA-family ATPase